MELEAGNKNPIDGINRIYEGICSRPRGSHDPDDFNILDYYYICREYNIDYNSIVSICNSNGMTDVFYAIRSFRNRYLRNIKSSSIFDLLQSKIILDEREILMDEKLAVMKKLIEDGIPIDGASFLIAVKRYMTGTFKVNFENSRK